MRQARFNATVLNVDGRPESRARRSEMLREAGFKVREASSGAAALRACRGCPDVLVLGTDLADMSATELCRQIKCHTATFSMMVLVISSGYERAQKLESGADWILCEPLEDEELVATLNSLVRIRWTLEQLRQRVDELELEAPTRAHRAGTLTHPPDECSAPLDCIEMWVNILKRDDIERPLVQHALEAIEHNLSLLRKLTRDKNPVHRESHTP
jgi:DNA-binding response OmpR family regulator